MATTGAITDIVPGETNAQCVLCERCGCKVLTTNAASLVEKEYTLPHMSLKADGTAQEVETHTTFWLVKDMYHFENIGFSHPVDGSTVKYLVCADCEIGPLGWHDTTKGDEFYLCAQSRIKYVQ